MQRQHSLDSLRGLLALVVLVGHSWQIFVFPAQAGPDAVFAALGIAARLAVLAFFALSGYVITASILANISARGHFDAESYVLARIFRIVPPLLLVIAATAGLALLLDLLEASRVSHQGAARRAFITDPLGQLVALASLGTHGELTGAWLNGPLWSLTFELRMYVVAGLIAATLCASSWLARCVAAVLLWLYVSRIGLYGALGAGINLQLACFAAFLCGAVAYRFRSAPTRQLLGAAAAFLAAAAIRLLQARGDSTAMDSDPVLLSSQVAMAAASAALIAVIGRGGEWSFLRRAGAYSYTLYIGHFPLLLALYFLAATFSPAVLTGYMAHVASAVAAICSWALLSAAGRRIERPAAQRRYAAGVLARRTQLPWAKIVAG